jgi:ATP-dependent RNA helicase DeaD
MLFSAAHPTLARALAAREYTTPTAVQAAVLAEDARARDLLVSAQTGSGKTVAFGLSFAAELLGDAPRFTSAGMPLALVIAPTRELAIQVHRELSWLYAETGARIATCVGGMDARREAQTLGRGAHIVVGTPGRLCDHLERGVLVLNQLRAVVLDEADEMLDMGFRDELERLLDATPKERRTLMFSATIPRDIATLAKRYQKNALRVATSSEVDAHRDIEYRAIPIIQRERDLAVVNLLRYHDAPGALVFCATRDGVTHLSANLHERGFAVAALSGELSQRERNQALQALRDGRARVCVATDVAARGLDLPDLGLVIHADLPNNKQVLVHRSGRTGRAGKKGVAVVLVPEQARMHVERMLSAAHLVATWSLAPTADDIRARDQEQLVKEIAKLADETNDEDRQVARALLAERDAEQLAAALVRLRREALPSPEELTIPMSMRPRSPQREIRPRPSEVRTFVRDRPNDRHDDRAHDRPAPGRDRPQHHAGSERPRYTPTDRPREHHAGPTDRPREHGAGPTDRPREHREVATGGTTLFTINVGRSKNADPKWLIPLLCRRGGITKREIGKIRILARETHVEIITDASDRFAEAIRRPDDKDRNIHIERLDAEPGS